jgi:hypothetical protein
MDRLQQDGRIALRSFRRTPMFTITAVCILAIGIGMAVAMLTVFDAVPVQIHESEYGETLGLASPRFPQVHPPATKGKA